MFVIPSEVEESQLLFRKIAKRAARDISVSIDMTKGSL
jgi:hypothetical protein